jgi:hypothetical protein
MSVGSVGNRGEKLHNKVTELMAKMEIEATWYGIQLKVLKTHSLLLAFY